jgi:hypothetical protein
MKPETQAFLTTIADSPIKRMIQASIEQAIADKADQNTSLYLPLVDRYGNPKPLSL